MTGGIVPGVHGRVAMVNPEKGQGECPGEVECQREEKSPQDEQGPGRKGPAVKFAHEERGHEIGLERTDAGTGFIDTDGALRKFNEVTLLEGDVAEPVEGFDAGGGDPLHERGDEGGFNATRPGHGQQKKEGGKSEVAKPAKASDGKQSGGGSTCGQKGCGPKDQAPIGVGGVDDKEDGPKKGGGEQDGEEPGSGERGAGRGPVGPAFPKKEGGKEGHEPAERVVGVEFPFGSEEPREGKEGECRGEDEERRGCRAGNHSGGGREAS